jgi:hypothetical protein
VRDTGGELPERSQLLGLHQAVLRGPEIVQRSGKFAGALLHLIEQSRVLDRDHCLIGEGFQQLDLGIGEAVEFSASKGDHPDWQATSH